MQAYEDVHFLDERWEKAGSVRIQQNKVACVILAAGSGTRLGACVPKALFTFRKTSQSLLAIFCKKILAQERTWNTSLPVYIMCFAKNLPKIRCYLLKNKNFGLKNLHLFPQESIIHPSKEEGPGGNAGVYRALQKAKILESWKQKHIEDVMIIPIDNPLAKPFDTQLIGVRFLHQMDVCVLAIKNQEHKGTMGSLVQSKAGMKIVEYFMVDKQFSPKYCSTNQFCFSRTFLEKAPFFSLPSYFVQKGQGYRKEQLLFDAFSVPEYSDDIENKNRTGALVRPEHLCYAPLKNREGPYGIAAVEAAMKKAGIV